MINLKPKENVFFNYFAVAANNCHKAALVLDELINNYTDLEAKIREIEEIEHDNDSVSHELITRLKKSFITPIDREDIYTLTNEIDSVVDRIQATAFRFQMFDVKTITKEMKELSHMIVKCTEKLPELMNGLKDLKRADRMKQTVIEINNVEEAADQVFRKAVTDVFRSDIPDLEKMKAKEILEFLENVVDTCEDVADKVEEVVMKHA